MNKKLLVPDIGDFKDVEIIEVLVKEGQSINKNDSNSNSEKKVVVTKTKQNDSSMKSQKEHYLKNSTIIIANDYIIYLLNLIFAIEQPVSDVKVINNIGVILNEYKGVGKHDS